VDRLKELIKYKGFQVPPADLEALLLSHPKVDDVGVIGITSIEKATELPRAYLVPAGGLDKYDDAARQALSKELIEWVAANVSPGPGATAICETNSSAHLRSPTTNNFEEVAS
jgi:acyl-coenzyme A synthetase/AMP-(fatty) acid ligase